MATTEVPSGRSRPLRPSGDPLRWLRANLFNTWYNAIISLALLALIGQALSALAVWLFSAQGWPAVVANLKLLMVWTYPAEFLWRPQLAFGLVAFLLGMSAAVWRGVVLTLAAGLAVICVVLALPTALLTPVEGQAALRAWQMLLLAALLTGVGFFIGRASGERLRWPLVMAWVLIYPVVILTIHGVDGALPVVNPSLWGGLMLTILLSASGIVLSFPLGVLLALGRRSDLPVIRWFCIAYIELIRGVPLVTVLYMGSLMLPLFLAGGENISQFVRAMIAITLFTAAYLAENVRGGLQAIPRGQIEAARALGLNVVQTTLLITLPQALRAVIPVLVGQFIALFKDTSLVIIIGLTDLLGAAQAVTAQPAWLGIPGGVWRETFLLVALIYWIFSFTMSRAARQIETGWNVK